MIHSLAVTLLVLTSALAIFGIVTTLLNRPAERPHVLAVGLVEALLVLQALIGAARVLGGHRLAEASTFLIYLAVSVCVLPLGLQFARAEPTRWGGTVIAVASIAIGVAELRLLSLWGSPVG
jgi:predicted membrane channel-forming protein YqfA (hemolysin III family)